MTDDAPIYAVGDIHGYLDQLDRAIGLIESDGGPDARIVFLGDYVDRGPDSRGVIERLMAGQTEGRPWTCLYGNHDRMFFRFVTEGAEHDAGVSRGLSWLNWRLGGDRTLGSYGVAAEVAPGFRFDDAGLETVSSYRTADADLDPDGLRSAVRSAVPQAHLSWLDTLPLTLEAGGYVFVHAGLRPGVPLSRQTEDDLVWIRDGWLNSGTGHRDHKVVHGHTVVDEPIDHGWRVAVDAGAGYGDTLVPCVLDDGTWWTLSPSGRRPMARV